MKKANIFCWYKKPSLGGWGSRTRDLGNGKRSRSGFFDL